MQNHKTQPILMVEDNERDYKNAMRAFTKADLNDVYWCQDGDDALDFLFNRGDYSDKEKHPRPGVILLDLNLPGTDGKEVLEKLKGDQNLKTIPVIVLTTSTDARDINSCYELGANSYMQKPIDIHELVNGIERLKDFWLEIAILPKAQD